MICLYGADRTNLASLPVLELSRLALAFRKRISVTFWIVLIPELTGIEVTPSLPNSEGLPWNLIIVSPSFSCSTILQI